MPYTAYHPESEDIHFVDQASPESDYVCIDCPETVEYVRSHFRNSDSANPTRVTAHFRYSNCTHGTVDQASDGAGGSGGGGGAGETQLHKRRKRAALHEALQRFPAADYDTEYTVGSKRADALLKFEDPHEKYGKGLVIEYQHKNEGKDIEATQEHFARHEYTTLWLWEDQFTFSSSIPEIDLFGGEVYTPWPDAVPKQSQWRGEGLHHEKRRKWRNAHEAGLTKTVVQADILKHWVVHTPHEHWKQTPWEDRFRGDSSKHIAQALVPRSPTTQNLKVTLPPEITDQIAIEIYRSTDWEDLFTATTSPLKRALFEWQVEKQIWTPETNVSVTYHLPYWLASSRQITRVRFNTRRKDIERRLIHLAGLTDSLKGSREVENDLEAGRKAYSGAFEDYAVTLEDPRKTSPNDYDAVSSWGGMFAIVPSELESTYRSNSATTNGASRIAEAPLSLALGQLDYPIPDNMATMKNNLENICSEGNHDWIGTISYWRECRTCGFSDELCSQLGQNV